MGTTQKNIIRSKQPSILKSPNGKKNVPFGGNNKNIFKKPNNEQPKKSK